MTGQAAGAAKIDPASVFIPNDAGYGKVTIEKKMGIEINFTFEFNVISRLTDHSCEAHVYNGELNYTDLGMKNEHKDITGTLTWMENNMGAGVMISLEAKSDKGKLEIYEAQLQFNNIDDNTRKRVGQVISGQILLPDESGALYIYGATISITNY